MVETSEPQTPSEVNSQRTVDKPQAFNHKPELHENEIGPVTKEVIFEWARSLPATDLPVVDIAAGRGIEAALLESNGVATIAQDPSEEYQEKSFHSGTHRIGIAEELPDADESVRGILCKDALIFLSPDQRAKAFKEAYRVLMPGGTFLLITEASSAYRGLYVPNSSQYPQTLSEDSYEKFVQEIERMKGDNEFFSIQYKCDAAEIAQQAEAAGLKVVTSELHDFKSPLAQENRWVPRATLVMIFRK